jgi:hypothetical protein
MRRLTHPVRSPLVDTAALIDAIYEASVAPEGWPRVLDGIAEVCDAEGTLLAVATRDDLRWLCSAAILKPVSKWLGGGEFGRDARSVRLVTRREPRFHTDLDAFTHAELEREPFYAGFLRPHGLGWCASTSIRSPSGETLVISVEKAHHKGPSIVARSRCSTGCGRISRAPRSSRRGSGSGARRPMSRRLPRSACRPPR